VEGDTQSDIKKYLAKSAEKLSRMAARPKSTCAA
jgi:hypothetical protein